MTGKNNDRRIRNGPQRPVIRLSVGKRGEKGGCWIGAATRPLQSHPDPKILKKCGQNRASSGP